MDQYRRDQDREEPADTPTDNALPGPTPLYLLTAGFRIPVNNAALFAG